MKFLIHPSGAIECEHEKCSEWHSEGHLLNELVYGDALYNTNGTQLCIGCKAIIGSDADRIGDYHAVCMPTIVARMVSLYGGIDGAHHKQWLIDRMLRTVLGKEDYEKWVRDMNADEEYDPWDVGIAP